MWPISDFLLNYSCRNWHFFGGMFEIIDKLLLNNCTILLLYRFDLTIVILFLFNVLQRSNPSIQLISDFRLNYLDMGIPFKINALPAGYLNEIFVKTIFSLINNWTILLLYWFQTFVSTARMVNFNINFCSDRGAIEFKSEWFTRRIFRCYGCSNGTFSSIYLHFHIFENQVHKQSECIKDLRSSCLWITNTGPFIIIPFYYVSRTNRNRSDSSPCPSFSPRLFLSSRKLRCLTVGTRYCDAFGRNYGVIAKRGAACGGLVSRAMRN